MTNGSREDSSFLPMTFDNIKKIFKEKAENFSSPLEQSFNEQLFLDFSVFLSVANPLFSRIYGDSWFTEAKIFRFATQEKNPLSPVKNSNGRYVRKAWNTDLGLSGEQVCQDILYGRNRYFDLTLQKDMLAYVAILSDLLLGIDIDFHYGDSSDQREDFLKYVQSLGVLCVYEPSKNGAHYFLVNSKITPIYNRQREILQVCDSLGIPFKVEFCSGCWIETSKKYDHAKTCVLGCGRVEGYSEKVKVLGTVENIFFPEVLQPLGTQKSLVAGIRNKPLVKGIPSDLSELESGSRNDMLFRYLCAEAEVLKDNLHGKTILQDIALAKWYRLKNKEGFSLQEALQCAESASSVLGTFDSMTSREAVAWAMNRLSLSCKYNLLSQEIELFKDNKICEDMDSFIADIRDEIRDRFPVGDVERAVLSIAKNYKYNPVLEYLRQLPENYDSSELDKLISLLEIQNKPLQCIYLKKWLMQAVCAQHNGETEGSFPFSVENVLTFQGKQGAGKTQLLKRLAVDPKWFHESASLSNSYDKDNPRRILTHWISELGEIGSTMRRDQDSLKAFISNSFDKYRLPYARYDIKSPRYTVLSGTVNDEAFISDDTGARRFWVIKTPDRIPIERIKEINTTALWSYINTLVEAEHSKGTPYDSIFRLTKEEASLSEKYVAKFQKRGDVFLELESMIVPISELPEGFKSLDWKTSLQIANDLPFTRKPNAVPLGKALSQLVRQNKIASKIKDGKTLYGIALDISVKELLEVRGMLFSLDSYKFWKKVKGEYTFNK